MNSATTCAQPPDSLTMTTWQPDSSIALTVWKVPRPPWITSSTLGTRRKSHIFSSTLPRNSISEPHVELGPSSTSRKCECCSSRAEEEAEFCTRLT